MSLFRVDGTTENILKEPSVEDLRKEYNFTFHRFFHLTLWTKRHWMCMFEVY